MSHGGSAPSAWLTRWAHLLPEAGTLLDVACGSGRHLRWAAKRGLAATGVDRDAAALAGLADLGGVAEIVVADIENGPWPFGGRAFDAVIVTNYLWRPLWPTLIGSVAPGGLLVCETFAAGNESVGKPSRPDFLLRPGELLSAVAPLRIVAFEDGFLDTPDRFVQRIVACREVAGAEPTSPRRYLLSRPPSAPG